MQRESGGGHAASPCACAGPSTWRPAMYRACLRLGMISNKIWRS
ncbi:Uncharacterised protein [Bordetella pertussis]|nr:Uncharacterised protein [Bordetella pertussis]